MTSTRPLKTGDLVRLPGRTAVVESVALDGASFTDTAGARHRAVDAEAVPLAGVRELLSPFPLTFITPGGNL